MKANMITSTNVKAGGVAYVACVMNNLDCTEKNTFGGLLPQCSNFDDILKNMFVFVDIISMVDRSVQSIDQNYAQNTGIGFH